MLSVVKHQLSKPSLDLVCKSFQKSLTANFAECTVEVVECPDLTAAPWSLSLPGLGGDPRVADVGGVPNLIPTVKVEKQYCIYEVATLCELGQGMVIGASAVASQLVGKNAELVNNVSTCGDGDTGVTRSKYTLITDEDKDTYECRDYPHRDFGLLGNLYLCRGRPGHVIHVTARKRTGPDNFIHCLNAGLSADFADPVAVGGTFLLTNGKAKSHVMPGFSCTPLTCEGDVESWLRFFDMSGPLTHTSVFVSKDPGLDLRLEHSHFFSEHGDGGHYHEDTTPDTVCYEGYFNVAEFIFRVDAPAESHMIGRD